MRAIWVSSRPANPDTVLLHRRMPQGFTLLELLVVLVLVALVTGLVAPIASNGLNAARERAVAAELQALLESLPVRTFASGQAQEYDGALLSSLLGEVPAGWRLTLNLPLRYGASGAASGGEVGLVGPGRAPLRWQVKSVSGDVTELPSRP